MKTPLPSVRSTIIKFECWKTMDLYEMNRDMQADMNRLIGSCIERVRYYELNQPERGFSIDNHHRVDFAIEFETNTSEIFYLAWNSERSHFYPGLGTLLEESYFDKQDLKCWDVSDDNAYKTIIGKPVMSIQVFWDWIKNRAGKKCYFPSDIEIEFVSGESIVLAIGEFGKDKQGKSYLENTPGGDIYIIFGKQTAKSLLRGRYTVNSIYFPLTHESVA